MTVKESLAVTHPGLAAEWHPEENGDLTPASIVAGSNKKVWWQCQADLSHVWQARVAHRLNGSGCPMCGGRIATPSTSLQMLHPHLASEWHPGKNGDLTPNQVKPQSNKKVWWRCSLNPSHEWEAVIGSRVRGNGCPYCAGQRVTPGTSLQALYPAIADEWHPKKNGELSPNDVKPGSGRKVWWRCSVDPMHEWEAVIASRSGGRRCPICSHRRVTPTTSLQGLYPQLAAEWHPEKNGTLTPDQVAPGSGKKAWWRCSVDPSHEWEAVIGERTTTKRPGTGCPACVSKLVTSKTSLQTLYPEVAADWHPEKNGKRTPNDVFPKSNKQVWWRCQKDFSHEWQQVIADRVEGRGCPFCNGRIATATTSLQARYPHLAAEWHPEKNADLTPSDISPGSERKVWWRCSVDPSHEWEAVVYSRTSGRGCPLCNRGWTIAAIRSFVASLREYLTVFTPAELYSLFQQNGLYTSSGKGKTFVKALATGRFPLVEIEKFVKGEPSLVDQFFDDSDQLLETIQAREAEFNSHTTVDEITGALPDDTLMVDAGGQNEEDLAYTLPAVETRAILSSLDHIIISSADEETIEFLLSSAVAKIWKHAFHDEQTAVAQAEQESSNEYIERVRKGFLNEYMQARELALPQGYNFHDALGNPIEPNLMQRLIAVRVLNHRRVGNWSGTGAGKTLSAILASRVIDAGLTIVCCPNSVVEGWEDAILESFPQSQVQIKTFTPQWNEATDPLWNSAPYEWRKFPRYLILNYEAFQQPYSAASIRLLTKQEPIDCVIIDEIHCAKQRKTEDLSQRRRLVAAMVSLATEQNPDICVLGLSATPVINNLQEGKSMVELVTGVAHDDLDIRPTVSNCMTLYQRLVRLGIRWIPEYQIAYEQHEVEVDCALFLDEIRALGQRGSPLALEEILTHARLPVIRQQIVPKTLIYTHFIRGIGRLLWEALTADGWKVGFYTGEEKSGLNGFLRGDIDVLIGSSAIGTGVDGLQQVCNRLIVNVLPWTAAEFEQLKGRLFRQGQQQPVTMILPLTYALVNGERWSWCESKLQRLRFKKSIADAAVDGVVPEGHLRSPAQAYQDLMAWLRQLEAGEVQVISRSRTVVPLLDSVEGQRQMRRYGTFSAMNRRWNQGRSADTHQRLQDNPEEWAHYHTLYREQRKEWAVVPYEEIIRWCRSHLYDARHLVARSPVCTSPARS